MYVLTWTCSIAGLYLTPYKLWWTWQRVGRTWKAVSSLGSLHSTPLQTCMPPCWQKRKKSARISLSNSLCLCACLHTCSCGLTCAVLPSLTSESNMSLLALTNSFSAGMSSCTRNSFLVPSIPLSRDLNSCSTLSKDTERAKGKKKDTTLIIDKQWLYYMFSIFIVYDACVTV